MRLTRPACRAENGMVASAHYLASTAALDILKRGGTATDAAICAASVLGVVQPHMIGLGGDAFWLIYEAKTRTVHAINGSGPCGSAISLADYAGMASIPQRGPRAAITVPGAVDSWRLAHERFGRLPMADLLATAVDLARRGMPISDDLAGWIAEDRDALAADPGAASLFLDDGCAPKAGARLRQAALAETLELIADAGPRAFYERTVAASPTISPAAAASSPTPIFSIIGPALLRRLRPSIADTRPTSCRRRRRASRVCSS